MSSTAADIRIVSGCPTDDEIAALTAVLVVASAQASAVDSRYRDSGPVDEWGRPDLLHRSQMSFSPYAFGLGGR